jgi:hypothetical protein
MAQHFTKFEVLTGNGKYRLKEKERRIFGCPIPEKRLLY